MSGFHNLISTGESCNSYKTKLLQMINDFDQQKQNCKTILGIANLLNSSIVSFAFNDMYREGKFKDNFIWLFIDAIIDKQNLGHYVEKLLRVYATYLNNGIALIAWIKNSKELESLIKWCKCLSINYNIVQIKNRYDEYCVTHNQIVPEDDPCPEYSSDSCDIEYDYDVSENKIIIHDKQYVGTFEELNFEWDGRYVDGGYTL